MATGDHGIPRETVGATGNHGGHGSHGKPQEPWEPRGPTVNKQPTQARIPRDTTGGEGFGATDRGRGYAPLGCRQVDEDNSHQSSIRELPLHLLRLSTTTTTTTTTANTIPTPTTATIITTATTTTTTITTTTIAAATTTTIIRE